MGVIWGTNEGDYLDAGSTGSIVRGWDRSNAPGDQGPADDNDHLWGDAGNDVLDGGNGDDVLLGRGGDDRVYGAAGEDWLYLHWINSELPGADTLRGGTGIDTLSISHSNNFAGFVFVMPDPGAVTVLPTGQNIQGIERLHYFGDQQDDVITGGRFADEIDGRFGGADVLRGLGGNDTLSGSTSGADLAGGTGNDDVVVQVEAGGSGRFMGGAGVDRLSLILTGLEGNWSFAVADLQGRFLLTPAITLGGFERIDLEGSDQRDAVTGGAFADRMLGRGGDDALSGLGGADSLDGGFGDDTLTGGAGDDHLFEYEVPIAQGSNGRNVMFGGSGDDSMTGANDRDFLFGGSGDDSLNGRYGFDVLNGGAGSDLMTGGEWADKFDFTLAPVVGEVDVITDFVSGKDQIRLAGAAFGGMAAGVLGADDFVAGTVAGDDSDRILFDSALGQVWFDADGAGGTAAVLFLTLGGGAALGAGDILIL